MAFYHIKLKAIIAFGISSIIFTYDLTIVLNVERGGLGENIANGRIPIVCTILF